MADPFGNRNIYRQAVGHAGLEYFSVSFKETELFIGAERDLSCEALTCVKKLRFELDDYIAGHEAFLKSLVPVEPQKNAPDIALAMMAAAKKAGVGPMAAVAGAFSRFVGEELLNFSPEVIVENGGDIFLSTERERTVAVYAGLSPLSMKIAVVIPAKSRLGVCTSAGRVGPSLSLGRADAAMILSPDAALADAAATTLGNAIQKADDIPFALESVLKMEGVKAALAICGETLGALGDIALTQI